MSLSYFTDKESKAWSYCRDGQEWGSYAGLYDSKRLGLSASSLCMINEEHVAAEAAYILTSKKCVRGRQSENKHAQETRAA